MHCANTATAAFATLTALSWVYAGRTLTDSKGFWLNMKNAPNLDKSAIELFASYDTVDIHWVLGGKICGIRVQPSLVLPRADVIDNESYVAFAHQD